jgi:hypothetical protein
MRRYSKGQRKLVANGLVLLANIAAGGLVLGQLVTGRINWWAFAAGLVVTTTLYVSGFVFMKGIEDLK